MPTPEELKVEEEKAAKEEQEKKDAEALALAEAKKTETGKEPIMIPKSRFDEEIKRRKESEARLEVIEKEQASQLEKQLVADGKHKELAEERAKTIAELKPVAEQVDSYEETLKGVLDAQVEQIPEDLRGLIPEEMSTKQQLDWIAKNSALLHKSKPFDIGAGKRGGSNNNKGIDLNQDEKYFAEKAGMTEEEYAKYKD